MSNCSDIVEATGPHLYVEVKEQSALMLWHRSFPFASFAAPHHTSSAERWTGSGSNKPNPSVHLSDLFFSQFMARRLVEALSFLLRARWKNGDRKKKRKWKKTPCRSEWFWHRLYNLRRWFDESSWIICDGGLWHILGLTAVKATNSAQPKALSWTALYLKKGGSLTPPGSFCWKVRRSLFEPFCCPVLTAVGGLELGGQRSFPCTSCSLWSAPRVHLLWIMKPSLYAHLHILSSRKRQSVPPDITSETLLINNRAPVWEGPGFAGLKAGIWFLFIYFFHT